MQPINAATSPEVQMTENFETLSWASVFGKNHPECDGLVFAWYGGIWGGFTIAADDVTLANNVGNYMVVERATGAVSVSTSIANWENLGDYARVYYLRTVGGVVVEELDYRAGPGGVFGGVSTIGRHAIPVNAAAIRPTQTSGCDGLAVVELAADQPEVASLDFPAGSDTKAQFSLPMPKSWDRQEITFKAIWGHASGGSSFGVTWALQGVALADGDPMGVSFGTAQNSADTGGTADDQYISPESNPIVVTPGSPSSAADYVIHFQLTRLGASDTLDIPARLMGLYIIIGTSAENDE